MVFIINGTRIDKDLDRVGLLNELPEWSLLTGT